MLIIRNAQLEVLAAADRAQFESELVAMVIECFRDELGSSLELPVESSEIRVLVRQAIERARGYGIDDEADIERFVELSFELGHAFDERPEFEWAREILLAKASSGTARMVMLDDRLDRES